MAGRMPQRPVQKPGGGSPRAWFGDWQRGPSLAVSQEAVGPLPPARSLTTEAAVWCGVGAGEGPLSTCGVEAWDPIDPDRRKGGFCGTVQLPPSLGTSGPENTDLPGWQPVIFPLAVPLGRTEVRVEAAGVDLPGTKTPAPCLRFCCHTWTPALSERGHKGALGQPQPWLVCRRSGRPRRPPGRLPLSPLHSCLAAPGDLHPTLAQSAEPVPFRRPRLLGRIPVPAGASGGPRGLHCSPDGLLFLTAGADPFVHVLDLEGRCLCRLHCRVPGAGDFVPEDVAVTAAGLVVVSDLIHGAVRALQHTVRAPQGHWVTVGTFPAPRGLAVDAQGYVLVADYLDGAVHSLTLGPNLEVQAPTSLLGLRGPCWVGPGPDGGVAVSEECGDVCLFGSARQPLGQLGAPRGHEFGSPAGVCTDMEGQLVVADEVQRRVILFPRAGPPINLVCKGLGRPLGVTCAPQGQIVVADSRDSHIKVYQHQSDLA